LEVKIHAPDDYQPQVQAEIKKLETEREGNERRCMEELQEAFNNELNTAASKIKVCNDFILENRDRFTFCIQG
jgi:hypothetical protein